MNDGNKIIIECLNTFGRVPEQWELLKMIKQLQSNWNILREYIREIPEEEFVNSEWYVNILDKISELEKE